MKKILILMVCVCTSVIATAQTKVTWGVEAGVGFSSWMGEGASHSDALFNPRVGVSVDVPLTGLVSFQTGLDYESKGAQYKIGGYDVTVDQNYLRMPLLAAFHLGTTANFDVVVRGGAYLACGISGKNNVEDGDLTYSWSTFKDLDFPSSDPNVTETLKGFHRFDAGFQVGAALDFTRWTVGMDAEFGLCRIQRDGPRNLSLFVGVGYKF
ncbi:MAG TPA: PorT family protein [Candidatus Phocaeicola gallistercoris]|nr:PorT family protein [Candidatus Phocaeicola gallistercoris]